MEPGLSWKFEQGAENVYYRNVANFRINKALLLLVAVMVLAACAPPVKEVAPEMFWPMPPETPRVKFLDYIVGSIDVTRDRSKKYTSILFGEAGEATFYKPSFVTVRGNVLYVSDVMGIHVYDYNRKSYGIFGQGVISSPAGLAMDSSGILYVADTGARSIIKLDALGRGIGKFRDPELLENMGGIALDEERGRLYVANTKKHNVIILDMDMHYIATLGSRGDAPGLFNFPYDVAVGKDGTLFVLDSGNFRVQVFDSEGRFLRMFGRVGTTAGHFARPKGIALSSDGYLFIVDAAYGNFQIFDEYGNVYLAVGRSGTLLAEFLLPMGIAISEDDKIYVVDQLNKRVQVFQYLKYE